MKIDIKLINRHWAVEGYCKDDPIVRNPVHNAIIFQDRVFFYWHAIIKSPDYTLVEYLEVPSVKIDEIIQEKDYDLAD